MLPSLKSKKKFNCTVFSVLNVNESTWILYKISFKDMVSPSLRSSDEFFCKRGSEEAEFIGGVPINC
jgi:hypothetical protein